jgi:hypothetical protein
MTTTTISTEDQPMQTPQADNGAVKLTSAELILLRTIARTAAGVFSAEYIHLADKLHQAKEIMMLF